MRAIRYRANVDKPRTWQDVALSWEETDEAPFAEGEVRVRVVASAVNRADLLQVIGKYPPPAGESEILGLEVAGVIDEMGAGVRGWTAGSRVCALLAGGGYAERVAVPAGQLLPVPDGMRLEDAAALPEVLATAFLNIYLEAGLGPGETCLVHSGASGVGSAAIQLCRALGNTVLTTARSERKRAFCQSLGASLSLDPEGGFARAAKAATGGRGPDVILDAVGGTYLQENLDALAPRGRLVLIGNMSGTRGDFDVNRLFVKRQRIIGSVLRGRSRPEKAEIMATMRERVWPYVERGEIRPIVDRIVPIERVAEAFDAIDSNATIGKIVLRIA